MILSSPAAPTPYMNYYHLFFFFFSSRRLTLVRDIYPVFSLLQLEAETGESALFSSFSSPKLKFNYD